LNIEETGTVRKVPDHVVMICATAPGGRGPVFGHDVTCHPFTPPELGQSVSLFLLEESFHCSTTSDTSLWKESPANISLSRSHPFSQPLPLPFKRSLSIDMDLSTVTGLDDKPFGDSRSQGDSKSLSDGSLHSDKESEVSEHSSESDRSRRSFVPSSLRTGRSSGLHSTTSRPDTPTFGPSSSSRPSTSATGDEELYEELSHTDHAEYGISSIPSRILNPQVPKGPVSPDSDPTWPALPHLASQTLRTSPSVLRQTPSVRSGLQAAFDSETSYSEYIKFDNEEPNNGVGDGESFTPDTSVTSVEDGEVDLDDPRITVPWARDQILAGLSFPGKWLRPINT
jgi:hypothetical protein